MGFRLKTELKPKQEFLNGYYTTKYKYKRSDPKKTEEIERAIEALNDEDAKELLKRKYINNEKMEFIAMAMNVSRATAFRIHIKALEALEMPEGMVSE